GGEPLAIRTKRDAARPFATAGYLVCAFFATGARIPEHDLSIPAGRGKPFAVGTVGDGVHGMPTVAAKRGQLLSRGQLPSANRGILAGGSESLAIGTEGHIGDRLGVALECVQEPFGVLRLLSVDGCAKARQYPPFPRQGQGSH